MSMNAVPVLKPSTTPQPPIKPHKRTHEPVLSNTTKSHRHKPVSNNILGQYPRCRAHHHLNQPPHRNHPLVTLPFPSPSPPSHAFHPSFTLPHLLNPPAHLKINTFSPTQNTKHKAQSTIQLQLKPHPIPSHPTTQTPNQLRFLAKNSTYAPK